MVYDVEDETLLKMGTGSQVQRYPLAHLYYLYILSMALPQAEKNFWSTELGMCGYVWTLRKTKQWTNRTTKPPVIRFTY